MVVIKSLERNDTTQYHLDVIGFRVINLPLAENVKGHLEDYFTRQTANICLSLHFSHLSCRGPQTGSHTCITYDAVNHAYIDARKRIRKLNFFSDKHDVNHYQKR